MNTDKQIDLTEDRSARIRKDTVVINESGQHAGYQGIELTYYELIKILHNSYYSVEEISEAVDKVEEIEDEKESGILSKFF